MTKKILGILREEKQPVERRVPFLPEQCREMLSRWPDLEIWVQPSPHRCVPDEAYSKVGCLVAEDLSGAHWLFGVKEVPAALLIKNKPYFIFSHVIKKQPYNRGMFQQMIENGNSLYDYECFTDLSGVRTVAFGHFAGLVGAYNGLRAWGKRNGQFDLTPAYQLSSLDQMYAAISKLSLGNLKVVVTGTGRVGNGIVEVLEKAGISKVNPEAFLELDYKYPVYTQLSSGHLYERLDGEKWSTEWFHKNPGLVRSLFVPYTQKADLFIAGAYWNPLSPKLFRRQDMLHSQFRLKVIADVTCDIDGSIPSTVRASTITDPFYDFDPFNGIDLPAFAHPKAVTVMAVDNLPCEMPIDASRAFGKQLEKEVVPELMLGQESVVLEKAQILKDGKITSAFSYLEAYAFNNNEAYFQLD